MKRILTVTRHDTPGSDSALPPPVTFEFLQPTGYLAGRMMKQEPTMAQGLLAFAASSIMAALSGVESDPPHGVAIIVGEEGAILHVFLLSEQDDLNLGDPEPGKPDAAPFWNEAMLQNLYDQMTAARDERDARFAAQAEGAAAHQAGSPEQFKAQEAADQMEVDAAKA